MKFYATTKPFKLNSKHPNSYRIALLKVNAIFLFFNYKKINLIYLKYSGTENLHKW